jgi:pimeloyl-ACP methyl ester carboxylesterase
VRLICVHGLGVTGAYFRPLARELRRRGHDVAVPELPKEPQPMERLGDALVPFLPGALVANSMGCQAAVEVAIRRSGLVSHLVLVGPTVDPHRRPWPRLLPGFALDCAREPPSLWWIIARDYAAMGPRRFVGTARLAYAHRIEERLPLVPAPALVVRGGRDGFVSQRWCEEAAALLPLGRLVTIPGEPHAVHYTAPSAVADEVEQHVGERRRVLDHRDVPRSRDDRDP